MKRGLRSQERIAFALRQAEPGTEVQQGCRKPGGGVQTFYRWKKTCAGSGAAEVRRLKQVNDQDLPDLGWRDGS